MQMMPRFIHAVTPESFPFLAAVDLPTCSNAEAVSIVTFFAGGDPLSAEEVAFMGRAFDHNWTTRVAGEAILFQRISAAIGRKISAADRALIEPLFVAQSKMAAAIGVSCTEVNQVTVIDAINAINSGQ